MNRVNIFLNIAISICLVLVVFLMYTEYSNSKKIINIVEEFKQEKVKYQKLTNLAKQIDNYGNFETDFIRKEDYLNNKVNQSNWGNEYGYKTELTKLTYERDKLLDYISHNMTILDKYEIFYDKLSKELHLGCLDDIRIIAEFNRLYINSKPFKQSDNNKYIIPKNQTVTFKMEKYTLNLCDNKIDTTETIKNINYALYQ